MNICSITVCKENVHGHGYCQKHYQRWWHHGNPNTVLYERHGMRKSPEYRIWCHIKARCLNPTDAAYKYYGARGITVCDRWIESFQAFLDDMGSRPKGMTLDRRDNQGHYEQSNCRWTTQAVQARNKRMYHSNTSGYRGVTRSRGSSSWIAQIGGRHLGTRKTPEAAARLYDEAAKELWGVEALLNFS